MISRDQAKEAAEVVLKPSRQVLEAKQKKTAKMVSRRQSPVFPALFAAGAALIAFEYSDSLITSAGIGTVVGWAIGEHFRRPI